MTALNEYLDQGFKDSKNEIVGRIRAFQFPNTSGGGKAAPNELARLLRVLEGMFIQGLQVHEDEEMKAAVNQGIYVWDNEGNVVFDEPVLRCAVR